MADQKDQGTDPPAENPAFLPLKKRAMAEKSLIGYNRGPESDSESDSDSDSESDSDSDSESDSDSDSESDPSSEDEDVMVLPEEEDKKETLQELQIKAFYSIIQAFTLETSTMSNKRSEIIEKLKNEWQISDETHISCEDKIQKNLLTLQQKEDSSVSDEKEVQVVPETPLTKPATPSSTCVPKAGKSWGSVNPESLIGKWVRVRLPDESEFEEFIIKDYDAKEGMHRLETPDSNAMEVDDPYSWMDLREISPDDIMWEGGVKPNFGAPNQLNLHQQLHEPYPEYLSKS